MWALFTILSWLTLATATSHDLMKSPLLSRAVQSSAICLNTYNWMQNSKQQTPCLVVSYLEAQCNEGDWNVPPLSSPDSHYDTPNNTNLQLSPCACSWVAYNLYAGCTLCQGTQFNLSVLTWDAWSVQCGTFVSTTDYYPPNINIPDATALPYWSITDPRTWTARRFDLNAAYTIYTQAHPDIIPSSLPSPSASSPAKKSTPLGAIIGGAVGGVVFLCIVAGIIVWYIVNKRRRDENEHGDLYRYGTLDLGSDSQHGRPVRTHSTSLGSIGAMISHIGGDQPTSPTRYSSGGILQHMSPEPFTAVPTHSPSNSHGSMQVTSRYSSYGGGPTTPPNHRPSQSQSSIYTTAGAPLTRPPTIDETASQYTSGPLGSPSTDDSREMGWLTPRRPVRLNPPSYADTMSAGRVGGAHNAQNSLDNSQSGSPGELGTSDGGPRAGSSQVDVNDSSTVSGTTVISSGGSALGDRKLRPSP
ncbi:hypothetical protein JAAARDRAFT_39713 [Jaapia argillacea MUCL 33604]|uniref:Mid2 domain-containing protein n=1 Tax=Jaapia argillacea MUCL 33604 TaxID=933084 RepID=A0A067PNX5_9AGAM|nr:hypothetical protein JAAARDRAFT_39713 [Jaapia argillacea MUCL 33604]